jgi:hypothetical protein
METPACGEQGLILPAVTLSRRDELQGAVAMVRVGPIDEARDPAARAGETVERLGGKVGLVLERLEQRLAVGLSLLVAVRLNAGTTPRRCRVASMVAPFIGAPLSECRPGGFGVARLRLDARGQSAAACSALSCSKTSRPTTERLNTPIIRAAGIRTLHRAIVPAFPAAA